MLEGAVPYGRPPATRPRVRPVHWVWSLRPAAKGCPFHAISMDEAAHVAVVDHAKCMGCGACEHTCAVGAMKLERDPAKGEPLDIEELSRTLRGQVAGGLVQR